MTTENEFRGPTSSLIPPDSVRSVFVSDVHLGSRHCRAEELLAYLNRVRPRDLYLVGDFLDGWKLARRWRWSAVYNQVIERLIDLGEHGTRLHYTPGNHDEFLRSSPLVRHLQKRNIVTIEDKIVHETMSGEKFLVIHGDQFDSVEQGAAWVSGLADVAYDGLMNVNYLWSKLARWSDERRYRFSRRIKQSVKKCVKFFSNYEGRLIDYAKSQNCDGVICGHIHIPAMYETAGVTYINTGDWVENCSCLVEYEDGRMALEWFFEPDVRIERCPPKTSESSESSATFLRAGAGHAPLNVSAAR